MSTGGELSWTWTLFTLPVELEITKHLELSHDNHNAADAAAACIHAPEPALLGAAAVAPWTICPMKQLDQICCCTIELMTCFFFFYLEFFSSDCSYTMTLNPRRSFCFCGVCVQSCSLLGIDPKLSAITRIDTRPSPWTTRSISENIWTEMLQS